MVAAMVCFALEDVLLKQVSSVLPVGQVLALTGAGCGLIFLVIASLGRTPLMWRALLLPAVLLRNLSEALGSVVFVTALALTRLSEVSAILQATPLAMTLGAALFLGESVGWRRWTAIGIGFIGVLLVIQPGMAGFTPASLYAVATVVLLAVRDLCSRAVPKDVPSEQLTAWAFLSLVPAGLVAMLFAGAEPVRLASPEWVRMGAILVVGGCGYYAIVAATRTGEVSAVVPFRYTRLLFAMCLAYLVFGERPDGKMIAGAVLIVGTGLYTIWRTALRSRENV